MSKKQLLTESEVRRFMALANLAPLTDRVIKEEYSVGGTEDQGGKENELEEMYAEDTMGEEPPAEESPAGGEEEIELGDMDGEGGEAGGEFSPEEMKKATEVLKVLFPGKNFEFDVAGEESAEESPMPPERDSEEDSEGDEEEGDEEEGDEEDDEEESEEDQEEYQEAQNPLALQESLVQNVLNRVTARLVSEARKAKKEGKKTLKKEKVSAAQKMKDLRDKKKKKKLEEANAPAPKATNSNGPKKGAGSATKGTFGVTSKVANQEWKQGKEGKGGHELETVSASTEHTVSHGKTNLATKGKK